jgi:hypothetical protein
MLCSNDVQLELLQTIQFQLYTSVQVTVKHLISHARH